MIEGKLVHTVQRQGTPLLYIFEVQGAVPPGSLTKAASSDRAVERN